MDQYRQLELFDLAEKESVADVGSFAGLEAANEKRFGDAERFFNIVLSKDRDSASAWSNLGNVHLSLGKPTQALGDFSKAIELASDVSGFHASNFGTGASLYVFVMHRSLPSNGAHSLYLAPGLQLLQRLSAFESSSKQLHPAQVPLHSLIRRLGGPLLSLCLLVNMQCQTTT